MTAQSNAATFAKLHQAATGFIMPNAWDIASALIFLEAGFPAIGTTSAGIAFSVGKQDYAVADPRLAVTEDEMFTRINDISNSVTIPVNGDLEAGFGDSPEAVAKTIRRAIQSGLAGANIEDKQAMNPNLYDKVLAVERICAARETIDAMQSEFVLTARCDAIQYSDKGIGQAIDRSNQYYEAGAHCLFTPGVSDIDSIKILAREINGPLNMVMGLGTSEGNANEWLQAGVQRISLGGSVARAALGFIKQAANEIRDKGTISFAQSQMPHAELNAMFAQAQNNKNRV